MSAGIDGGSLCGNFQVNDRGLPWQSISSRGLRIDMSEAEASAERATNVAQKHCWAFGAVKKGSPPLEPHRSSERALLKPRALEETKDNEAGRSRSFGRKMQRPLTNVKISEEPGVISTFERSDVGQKDGLFPAQN